VFATLGDRCTNPRICAKPPIKKRVFKQVGFVSNQLKQKYLQAGSEYLMFLVCGLIYVFNVSDNFE
jgi:hypothetical protein